MLIIQIKGRNRRKRGRTEKRASQENKRTKLSEKEKSLNSSRKKNVFLFLIPISINFPEILPFLFGFAFFPSSEKTEEKRFESCFFSAPPFWLQFPSIMMIDGKWNKIVCIMSGELWQKKDWKVGFLIKSLRSSIFIFCLTSHFTQLILRLLRSSYQLYLHKYIIFRNKHNSNMPSKLIATNVGYLTENRRNVNELLRGGLVFGVSRAYKNQYNLIE